MKRAHDLGSDGCWCEPLITQPCRACPATPRDNCPQCGGLGLEPVYDQQASKIIVHNDPYLERCLTSEEIPNV